MNSYIPAFYVSATVVFIGATIPFLLCCLNKKKSSNIVQMKLSTGAHLIERETVL